MNRSDVSQLKGQQANGSLATAAGATAANAAAGQNGQQQQQQQAGQQANNVAGNQQQQYTIIGELPNDKQHLMSNGLPTINSFQFNGHSGGAKQCEVHHSVLHPNSIGSGIGGQHLTRGMATGTRASSSNGQQAKVSVNFCRAWLNKFPSRSKRIDVISRIFFPKMFALFNLVYWTTYLFREDDIVQA